MTGIDWVVLGSVTGLCLLIFIGGYRYEKRHRMPGPPVLPADDD